MKGWCRHRLEDGGESSSSVGRVAVTEILRTVSLRSPTVAYCNSWIGLY